MENGMATTISLGLNCHSREWKSIKKQHCMEVHGADTENAA